MNKDFNDGVVTGAILNEAMQPSSGDNEGCGSGIIGAIILVFIGGLIRFIYRMSVETFGEDATHTFLGWVWQAILAFWDFLGFYFFPEYRILNIPTNEYGTLALLMLGFVVIQTIVFYTTIFGLSKLKGWLMIFFHISMTILVFTFFTFMFSIPKLIWYTICFLWTF